MSGLTIYLILFFAFAISFRSPVLAAPSVSLTALPSTVVAGESFPVNFSVQNLDIGSTYYVKVFGGIGSTESAVQTHSGSTYLNFNESWLTFPLFVATQTGYSGSVMAKTNLEAGNYNIAVRLHVGSNNYDSSKISLNVAALPSPTHSPSPTPSLTAAPTATITPTPKKISFLINSPSSGVMGDTIDFHLQINDLKPNRDYLIKAFGGSNDNFGIETLSGSNWLNYNSAWDLFPKVITNSDVALIKVTLKVKTSETPGQVQVKFKIRDTVTSVDTESEGKFIDLTRPTSTPVPTITPSVTPYKTPTPSLTLSPTPSEEPTPTIVDENILTPSPPPPEVQGISDQIILTPTPFQTTIGQASRLPILFIIAGSVMVLVPLAIALIKK